MQWNEIIKTIWTNHKWYENSLYSLPVAVEYCIPEVWIIKKRSVYHQCQKERLIQSLII